MIIEIILGALIAGILLWAGSFVKMLKSFDTWRIGLVIAALVYLIMLCFQFSREWLFIELIGLVVYTSLALASKHIHPIWLSAGWMLHIGWDVFVHGGGHPGYVPVWYPGVCIGFDIIIAIYALNLVRRKKASL